MNRMKAAFIALAAGLGLTAQAQGGVTDSLTVTITPNAFYSVTITTPSAAQMDLGSVDLGASTWTVRPATVTINSSYAGTDLKLQGGVSGGWAFDGNTATSEADSLQAWAVFTDTSVGGVPSQSGGYFSGTTPGADDSDVVDSATNRDVGVNGASLRHFVALAAETGYKSMENIPNSTIDLNASKAHLWLRFKLPNSTTTRTHKNIMITLTAVENN